jgi:hypothetical protein
MNFLFLKSHFNASEYNVITNDVSDYIRLLVRIAHIICNHTLYSYTSHVTLYEQLKSFKLF